MIINMKLWRHEKQQQSNTHTDSRCLLIMWVRGASASDKRKKADDSNDFSSLRPWQRQLAAINN